MKGFRSSLFVVLLTMSVVAQNNTSYWQQKVHYKMDIDMDVDNHQYKGKQELTYTNNSPDTLYRVFYHLYFNAFQPGSEMDVRSRSVEDPDRRITDRISKLRPEEMGYLQPTSLTQDGVMLTYEVVGTVLEVSLNKPILPGQSTLFKMDWDAQVPIQIRRSGRNNSEGIALSMAQWYPKMAEYDFEGWHADPYIGREFHGVWGDFDVKLTLDKTYTVGGTGYLQNGNEIGHGYETPGVKVKKVKGKNLTWHFKAPMVHDFMWAADPDYVHDTLAMEDGPTLHFYYKNKPEIAENWKNLQAKTAMAMNFFSQNIGPYPYEQYSVVQGGDGGMEYAMSTLITGERNINSLIGVTVHELAHSWFQHVLATNESKHAWMDEGFTSFISSLCMSAITDQQSENPFARSYNGYYNLVESGKVQPQTTHSDRTEFNSAYGASSNSNRPVIFAQIA